MVFRADQILDAIRTPGYTMGRNRPIYVPCQRELTANNVAAEFGYIALRAGPASVLELRAIYAGPVSLRWCLLSDDEFNAPAAAAILGTKTEQADVPLWLTQTTTTVRQVARASAKVGTSTVSTGTNQNSLLYSEQLVAQTYAGVTDVSSAPGILHLPDSIVLYPDPKPVRLVACAQNGNIRARVTLFCREWPLNPSQY